MLNFVTSIVPAYDSAPLDSSAYACIFTDLPLVLHIPVSELGQHWFR